MGEQEEYAEKPVPEHARLGFMKPALVWAGFAYAYICIYISSQIMGGLGGSSGICSNNNRADLFYLFILDSLHIKDLSMDLIFH